MDGPKGYPGLVGAQPTVWVLLQQAFENCPQRTGPEQGCRYGRFSRVFTPASAFRTP
jgi:hypothetical protein